MDIEHLEYHGESPQDRFAFQRYRDEIGRGKSLLQLTAMAPAVTPWIRQNWSPRSFTRIMTPIGEFDEIICNVSYHFNKHGAKYGSIFSMTSAARKYFQENRHSGIRQPDGTVRFPRGIFERDGRIITWFG